MRVALVVNRVTAEIEKNFMPIVDAIHRCADKGADLILFPEAAITGLINNGNPSHDLPLGQPIPGRMTDALSEVARKRQVYVAIGILEREENKLFDSAILITPDGEIALKYRRISLGWHAKLADPDVYRQGKTFEKVYTPLGTFSFLICGDLFEGSILRRIRSLQPDWLLFPFARNFEDGSYDKERWNREEKPKYIERVDLLGITTFMVNYIADVELDGGSFGGTMVVLPDGEILAEFPIGKEGVLCVEV